MTLGPFRIIEPEGNFSTTDTATIVDGVFYVNNIMVKTYPPGIVSGVFGVDDGAGNIINIGYDDLGNFVRNFSLAEMVPLTVDRASHFYTHNGGLIYQLPADVPPYDGAQVDARTPEQWAADFGDYQRGQQSTFVDKVMTVATFAVLAVASGGGLAAGATEGAAGAADAGAAGADLGAGLTESSEAVSPLTDTMMPVPEVPAPGVSYVEPVQPEISVSPADLSTAAPTPAELPAQLSGPGAGVTTDALPQVVTEAAKPGIISQLSQQLESRKLIERAKGILQRELGLSEQDAYSTLQRQSRQRRRSMKEIAEAIILSEDIKRGQQPEP